MTAVFLVLMGLAVVFIGVVCTMFMDVSDRIASAGIVFYYLGSLLAIIGCLCALWIASGLKVSVG